MLPAEHARGEALLALARDRFDPNLTSIVEQVLRHSCAYEDPADWTPDPAAPDPTRHETNGRPLPGSDLPAIRPSLLRWLLTTPDATALLEPRGLRVWNARLAEPLDLIGCTLSARLELRYCLVEAPIRLANASLPTLSLRNTTLEQPLDAPFLKLHGPLTLDDITAAALNFNGVTINGEARFNNTVLTAITVALSMQGAHITNDLILEPNFQAAGKLHFKGIRIGGYITLSGACLTKADDAINFDSAIIQGSLYLKSTFECAGNIQMIDAEVGGQFNCDGAKLTAKDNILLLDQTRIRGSLLMRSLESAGLVRLFGTQVNGQVNLGNAELTATGDTLSLSRAIVGGHLLMSGILSHGTLRIFGSEISGNLECQEANLAKTGEALTLDSSNIHGNAFLRGIKCAGTISIRATEVRGQLNCDRASILSFNSTDMVVGKDFLWTSIQNSHETSLKLFGSGTMKSIRDDKSSWPLKGSLFINGLFAQDLHLHYPRTEEDRAQERWGREYPLHVSDRIAWLNLQPDILLAEPQPWLHLAALFEAKGHKRAAKRVIYELRKHQSRANWKNSRFKHLGYAWDTRFARLEQQPFFILIPILLLASFSGTTFHAYRAHFAQTSESAYKATHTPNPQPAPSYPKFQPFVYALENVLPVIKLGQDDKWALDPAHSSTGLYRTLVILRWFLILAGWVMGGILAAAVSARFRA